MEFNLLLSVKTFCNNYSGGTFLTVNPAQATVQWGG